MLPYAPSQDWQYLLILDACRYDSFVSVIGKTGLKGELSEVRTGVINTIEWYNKYWSTKNDIHLISAQGMPFHSNTNRAANNFKTAIKAWDSGVIDPNRTLQFLRDNHHEGERHLVHFVPPHLPFIGEQGRAFLKHLRAKGYRGGPTVYQAVQRYGRETGDWNELQEYYEEGLMRALRAIQEWLGWFDYFGGKIVITSDHGELIGEGGHYDHNQQRWKDVLERVPWFELFTA